MATLSLDDYTATSVWTDVVSTLGALASVEALIQCVSQDEVQIVFGGVSAPTNKSGVVLKRLDSVQFNAANVWVKNFDADGGLLSVTTL